MDRADRFAKAAFALLCIGSLVGFFVYPTYPNYDSYYSLLWGREVLDLQAPTFEGFRVPTEHPLAIVAGAALSLLGHLGDRVWVAWKASWRDRIVFAAVAASGPLVWFAVDFLVTGDPLFSLHYTAGSAEDLGRQKSLSELPSAIPQFFENLVKLPVLAAAVLGTALGVVISPRRMLMPIVLLGAGVVTFVAIGVAGASVIERYLAVPALALMVLAAVAIGGWTMLLPGWLRTGWMIAAVLLVVGGVAYTATHLNLSRFDNELRFRGQAHDDLTAVLQDPKVKAGLKCGPLTGPNHKIVPDSRWIADLGDGKVRARAESYRDDRDVPLQTKGVAIVVTSRFAIFKHAWTDAADDARIQVPPTGFERVKTTRFYAAYVHC
jgi:hypothetical protein